jgi:eukaryotic-like serine/threonine-protein kinase
LLNVIRRPSVLAVIAMREGKPDEGIRLLEPARRIELGVGPGSAPALAPYIRGLIYLSKKDGANAAVEFRKITERRYLYATSPTFSLSRLGLARAFALQGDTAKARTAYQDFLAIWKDGDADLLPLKEAKAEYAKLQ